MINVTIQKMIDFRVIKSLISKSAVYVYWLKFAVRIKHDEPRIIRNSAVRSYLQMKTSFRKKMAMKT